MKKSLISMLLILTATITIFLVIPAFAANAASASMSNFKKTVTYNNSTFTDVGSGQWYDSAVQTAAELGIMNGKGGGIFEPEGNIRVCEAIKMACVVHNIYNGGTAVFGQDAQPWYQPYVDYAMDNHILGNVEIGDYNSYINRDVMAYYFSRALPESELSAINTVKTLPDVEEDTNIGSAIFLLYRAGVLTGSDSYGTFEPDSPITRAQAAAIITRLAVPSERKHFVLNTVELTDEKRQRLSELKTYYNTTLQLKDICDVAYFGTSAGAYFYDNGLILLEEYTEYNADLYDHYPEGSYNSSFFYIDGEVYCILMSDPNTGVHDCTIFFDDGELIAWIDSHGRSHYNGYRWDQMQSYYAHAKEQCDWVSSRN